ncbi:MAG: FtsX-like permease family protein [Ruminococcaceae bacterium]|nr:FtsX-like permease family protein [Oscillospiraceae bacterium]
MRLRFYNVIYTIRLAFQGIFRNGLMSLATIFVLTSALIVTGCTWALKVNLDHNLKEINAYNKIVIFVAKETDENTVTLLREKIEDIEANGKKLIKTVEHKTKEQVLTELFETYGDKYADILQMYGDDNPCKDELILTYYDSSDVNTIKYQLDAINEQEDTFKTIEEINARYEVAEKIEEIKDIGGLIFTWLMVLLLIVSVFIIMNTIKLAVFSRRDEISIMRYVGASGSYVAFPFVLEGMVLGAFSSGIAFGLTYYIYRIFAVNIVGESGLITILPFSELIYELLIAFFGIGIGLGIIGSLLSLRKYNKD